MEQHELEQLRGFLTECREQLRSTQRQLSESERSREKLSEQDSSLLAEIHNSTLTVDIEQELQVSKDRNMRLNEEIKHLGTVIDSLRSKVDGEQSALAQAELAQQKLQLSLAQKVAEAEQLRSERARQTYSATECVARARPLCF